MSESSHCATCVFAREHGHWPMQGTHCRDCHRSWKSLSQAHCTVCHETFATNGVADLHWTKKEGHVHPSGISSLELHQESEGGVWRKSAGRVHHLASQASTLP
jgi:hypothetical protein